MLKDLHTDNPKVLMSFRLKSGMLGFPGGSLWKREFRNPARGGIRETFDETGLAVPIERLTPVNESPFRIAADGRELDLHMYHCLFEHFARGDRPVRKEPHKHSSWRFVPIRQLPTYVQSGILHPIVMKPDWGSIVSTYGSGFPRIPEYTSWLERDRVIEQKVRAGRYEFLDYIHDKEDGHLVF